jgi:hypothetical protein
MLACIACLTGCVAVGKPQAPPAGCEHSMLAKTAPWSDVVLTAAVFAAKGVLNPEQYQLAHEAAQRAGAALEGGVPGGMTAMDLVAIPGMAEISGGAILQVLAANDVIDPCDRQRLANYLWMIYGAHMDGLSLDILVKIATSLGLPGVILIIWYFDRKDQDKTLKQYREDMVEQRQMYKDNVELIKTCLATQKDLKDVVVLKAS